MIVPGSPHALLMAGGGDPLDELGVIARSVRFRSAATSYFRKTFGATGNQQKFQIRFCYKPTTNSANQHLLTSFSSNTDYSVVSLASNGFLGTSDVLRFFNSLSNVAQVALTSAPLYRDNSGHYDVCINVDTTQATAANRVIATVNGLPVTLSGTFPAQNTNLAYFNSTVPVDIGKISTAGYADGILSFFHFYDGAPPAVTSYGKFHPYTNQWRPYGKAIVAAVVNGGGANSYFLPFDDVTNLTTLAADASSKGNNFTANNISLTSGPTYDSLTDTPTNNFATVGVTFGGSDMTVSDGGLKVTSGSSATTLAQVSQFGMPTGSGVWEWDTTITAASISGCTAFVGLVNKSSPNDAGAYPGVNTNGWSYYGNLGVKTTNGSNVAYGTTFSQGDVIRTTFDATNGTLTFAKQTGGTGAFTSYGVAFSGLTNGPYYAAWGDGSVSNTFSAAVNFGQQPRTAAKTAGAQDVCTKNLALPPVPNAAMAFAAVTDSGANVQTTLATARASFGANYIEIFKRRDSAEGWRWRFSDDVANYLDSSSTAAKAAFPSLTGTSYVGYAIKVSALNGVAMGRLTHTGGVADTVTDGLGTSRKMVIFKNEATGSWYVYHPDLTAGKLLYLEQSVVETTDTTIGSVTTNSFGVAAAVASGTYRWIAFADVPGFIKVGSHTGNGVVDGPFDGNGFLPAFDLFKSAVDGGSYWGLVDSARNLYNVSNSDIFMNLTNAETTNVPAVDFVSTGTKLRSAAPDNANYNGSRIIYLAIAQYPFRYANAR